MSTLAENTVVRLTISHRFRGDDGRRNLSKLLLEKSCLIARTRNALIGYRNLPILLSSVFDSGVSGQVASTIGALVAPHATQVLQCTDLALHG